MKSESCRVSADGSTKHLISLDDGLGVEAVWIPQEGGVNLCVSCQVGCPNKCRHCATGRLSFERDLNLSEIVSEVRLLLDTHGTRGGNVRILFMGMGEPFLNYDSVVGAIARMVQEGIVASAADVIVSTSGIVPGIRALALERVRPRLAVTIAAVPDSKRLRVIPTTKLFPLDDVLAACRDFVATTGDEVVCEVPLIGGYNATVEDAQAIAEFLRGLRCEIQVVPFNCFASSPFEEPQQEAILAFTGVLTANGMKVALKPSYGKDISAGCGQLATTG